MDSYSKTTSKNPFKSMYMKKNLLLAITAFLLFGSSANAVDRTWNFMNWSATTLANLAADPTNWAAASATRYNNALALTAGVPITANGVAVSELAGLTFSAFAVDRIRIDYNTSPGRLLLNGASLFITVPDCSAGDTLVVYAKTASSSAARGVTVSNTSVVRYSTPDGVTPTSVDSLISIFTVTAAGPVVITTTGGLQFRMVSVSAPGTPAVSPVSTGISTTATNVFPVKTVYYNLSGTVAGHDFANLRKGMYIQKSLLNNGMTVNDKMYKASE